MSFVGVYQHRDRWQTKIYVNGKDRHIGVFASEEDAAKNYDWHAIRLLGRSNGTNFPDDDYSRFIPQRKSLPFESSKSIHLGKEIAEEIRMKHKRGEEIKDLAKQYDVTVASVGRIVNGTTYRRDTTVANVSVVYNPK